jgi:hypothetical protein
VIDCTVKKIYILDKNIVALLHSRKNPTTRFHKKQMDMLSVLRKKDKKGHIFSSITSIIEGRTRKREDVDEVNNSITYDTLEVDSFFCSAQTDSIFLKSTEADTARLFSKFSPLYDEKKIKEVLEFYFLNLDKSKVNGVIPINARDEFAFKLLDFINEKKLPLMSPIYQLILMDIYKIHIHKIDKKQKNKPQEPIKILNPKKKFKDINEKVHNVYSDLTIPNILAMFEGRMNPHERSTVTVRFLTLDEPLKEYVKLFKLKNCQTKLHQNQPGADIKKVNSYVDNDDVVDFLNNIYKKWEKAK